METDILIIIISLILSAFFSGMEIAYVSSNKIHIEIEKKQNDLIAKVLTKLTQKPSKFIATMLVGNNLALVVYAYYMGGILQSWIEGANFGYPWLTDFFVEFSLLTQTLISTLLVLITAEFLPKVFFQIYANSLLKIFAVPAYLFYVAFSFISSFIIWISDKVLKKFFKTEGDEVQLAFTKVELGNYITEQIESVETNEELDSEIQIFQNALEFSEVKSREVMIPRTEIVAVEKEESLSELNAMFTETGLSKILIYQESIDDIVGYVHSFELFKKPQSITDILRPVIFVPETMLVKDVLNILIKKRKSIAVVIDEYGGTSGMMTVEDIVEELFGEIEDEHDSVVLIEEEVAEGVYKFSARLEVDYINEAYKLELPEDENYETLGGLIVNHTEGIPEENDVVDIEGYQFHIIQTSNTKIELVQVRVIESD
ncbi:MAG TPA: hemolysin [Leeuwenhoekiella sp.]|uniref:hemolysin family protein n=1 Tax=Leeuwenhoekiella palythoae TaxID=573501 RepID=UPI000C515DC8|nr:hemolysin family protein [Leeuwenhoekiella palythoae]MBH13299.1 hemolysin [Leeuwenhoekiella sp.]UBZ09262.1 hemolysin family protein [Leeuwenhoekiella palythoae]HAX15021.1 hemolysin [Leeuwenhoekiella sp.]HCQ76955.1 hemolysin [Leeuwenhoekiella sp.]|tara:strand:+ start:2675 stop:3961 length:1287 start_codon:yes stop_codon:yes gene_type:complete